MSKEERNKIVPKLRFPEFRDSGDWNVKTLNDLGKFTGGGTPSRDNDDYWVGNIPWVSSSDITDDSINQIKINRFITEEALKDSATKLVPANSILLVSRVGVGKLAISRQPICTSQDFTNFTPLEDDIVFLAYYLKSKSETLFSFSQGMAIKGFTKDDISSLNLVLPKIDEQQKIADCLSSLDELITAQSQKLEALKAHKKGLMQQLFPAEGETVPKLRFEEFKDSGEWETHALSSEDIATFINEKKQLQELQLEFYVSTENLLPDYKGRTIASKLPASGSFTVFKKGDILVSNIRPYLKKVWFADVNGAASNDVIVIRANPKINSSFLSFLLKNDDFIDYIMKGAEGVKMPRGDKDLIKEYPLAFPKQEEQQKIANCLSSLDELITAQAEKIEALKAHKKGLMQGLFPVSV